MADENATQTTETPSPREFKIPVRNATPDIHEHQGKSFKIPVRGKQFSISIHSAAQPTQIASTPSQQADAEQNAKIQPHSDVKLEVWSPPWYERVRRTFVNSTPFQTLNNMAPEVSRALGITPTDVHMSEDYLRHQGQLVALENLTEGAFRKDPSDESGKWERRATGLAKGVSGLTTPDMLLLQAIPVGDLLGLGGGVAKMVLPRLVTSGFGASMAKGLVDDWKEHQKAKAAGDEGAASEIEGNMAVTAAMTLLLGYSAGRDIHTTARDFGTREKFNEHAQSIYGSDYNDLSDKQKAVVVYNVAADAAGSGVKARVDREMKRLAKVAKKTGLPTLSEVADTAAAKQKEFEDRAEAAKNLTKQILVRHHRAEAYKQEAAKREHTARQAADAQEQSRQADTIPSAEEQRGFGVEESRTAENLPVTGLRKTTERESGQRYDPEHPEPSIPVTERRVAGEPTPEVKAKTTAAERAVQERTEAQFGQSFTSLPVDRQKLAAAWLEKNHPEQWEAFKGTPAYERHLSAVKSAEMADAAVKQWLNWHPSGDDQPLAPGADAASGTAKLILNRSNIDSVLKADPETSRDLNEHTERFIGRSFDSLPAEMRAPALADYLRTKPEKFQAFMTDDLTERMRTGQHIDIANMDAQGMMRQRASLRMDQRDAIRRAMDEDLVSQMVTEERDRHHSELVAAITASETGRSPSLDEVNRVSKGLSEQASKMGLGQVNSPADLFKIEKDVLDLPTRTRTPAVNEFLLRMRQVRAAAQEHVLRELAEATAARLREDAENSIGPIIGSIVDLSQKASRMQQLADDLMTTGQTAKADEAQEAADHARQQADATAAGVAIVTNPAPEPTVTRNRPPMVVGRETHVVTPYNKEGHAAHYVLLPPGVVQASHHPVNFEPTEGYDQSAQKRRYESDKQAQTDMTVEATRPDHRVFYSDTSHPTDGPPIIAWRLDADGKLSLLQVVGGNGRDTIRSRARLLHPEAYEKMQDRGTERLFGLRLPEDHGASEFSGQRGDLYRLLDEPITDQAIWSRMGDETNRDAMKGSSAEQEGAAMATLLSPEYLKRLDAIFADLPDFETDKKGNRIPISLRTAMRVRSTDIAKLLSDAGIIAPNKLSEFVEQNGDRKGDLTSKAKDLVENMLVGMTVTRDEAGSRLLTNADPDTKNKLGRAAIFFVRAASAGEKWNLASYNTEALRLLEEVKDTAFRLAKATLSDVAKGKGVDTESMVARHLHPYNYVDKNGFNVEQFTLDLGGNKGEVSVDLPAGEPRNPAVEALAMALEKSPREYANMIGDYATRSEPSMFGAEDPAHAFNNAIAGKFVDGEGNPLRVLPEEWGAVAPMPEAVKAAIEDARGPLPVEPEVHAETVVADVMPDSSSVVEALPEGPRTVRELRKALAAHPEINKDIETAEKITQMFEHILPTALGGSMEDILGNHRLTYVFGGEDPEAPKSGGYFMMLNEAQAMIHLCDTADSSTYLHEMAHYIRRFMKPEYQAIANKFVGFVPGEGREWSREQEERFADAFVHYYHDGGIKRGNAEGTKKMEGVFAHISRAMQSIYNSVRTFANGPGNKELDAMFDEWHDWSTAERKPFIKRVDIDAIAEFADKVEIPKEAKVIEKSATSVSGKTQDVVFTEEKFAKAFLKRNAKKIGYYEMLKVKGEETTYIRVGSLSMKLRQPGLNETIELARKARSIEDDLKLENNPERRALLRGQLNNIEDKLRGSTSIIGAGKPEPKDTSIIQLVHGVSEMPQMDEPTTPAQAVTVQQVRGDPTAVSLGESSPRKTKTGKIAEPSKNPLYDVPAASLQAPKRPRGTPVVDPDVWRGHVEALGLPEGTPPPTVRLDPDVREMMIYPGQAEAAEGSLSALQHQDATILAAPAGAGKTWLLSAIAHHLLGDGGEKVGLLVTKSRNLIEDDDGYMDVARKFGIDVDNLPSDMSQLQTGMYATTYTSIRGDKDVLSVPWDFVLFDESAEASNWEEAEQGKAVTLLGHVAKKVVYSSATPYSKIMQIGYMHKLGLWPKGGFLQWGKQFGLVESGPNECSSRSTPEQLAKLRQQLIERGQWQTLYKDMTGVEARVALVPQTEEVRAGVRSIRAAFAKAGAAFQKAGMSKHITPVKGHEVIYLKRYLTAARLPNVIKLAKDLSEKGWSPIMFTEYRSPAEEGMEFFNKLPAGLGAEINKMLPPLPNVVEKMREAFGDKIAIFAGPHNAVRAGELKAFQAGEKDAMYMSFAAGSIGANAQDKIGTKPRAALFIDVPWSPVMLEQGTARPWRYGSKSNVAMYFFTSDSLPEMKTLATKTLPRMRSLKAAVYGEKYESDVSKAFRDAAGIPAEVRDFMQDEEEPDAADFEQDGKGVSYTHIDDVEIPSAAKAKNKGMKYKGKGEKLHQSPKDEDPFERLGSAAWDGLFGELKKLPAPEARAVTANEGVIRLEAEEAGRAAMGSGESAENAATRKTRDMANDIRLFMDNSDALYHGKKSIQRKAKAAQELGWSVFTSGYRVIEKVYRRAGLKEDGQEMRRRRTDWILTKGGYQGRLQTVFHEIIDGHKLSEKDIETMSRVVENRSLPGYVYDAKMLKVVPDIPERIVKAAFEYRNLTRDVRRTFASAGSVVVYFEDGMQKHRPYSAIEDDPYYFHRIYDWNKEYKSINAETGKIERHTLGEIMNMDPADVKREKLVDRFADEHGISRNKAQAFFDKNDRGIRLQGNAERAREFDIPLYERGRRSIERYIDQVSSVLASTEVHGQFREKTEPLLNKLSHGDASIIDHILTSDMDPVHLPEVDKEILGSTSTIVITGKMLWSPIKVGTHIWRATADANTRSLFFGLMRGMTHPKELVQRAMDCNALLDYTQSAYMREIGLKRESIGNKFLRFNGFNFEIQMSRIFLAATGRAFFERYAYPELVKDPTNTALRRKLRNLWGFSDEHLDNIIKNGYGPDDVRRMELGLANNIVGGGYASELPPIFRPDKNASPTMIHLNTLFRCTQMLHQYMIKTANQVGDRVFDEMKEEGFKSSDTYKQLLRFAFNAGLAGFALNQLIYQRHRLVGSPEAEIEKRRNEWLAAHPASSEALWWAMANYSMAIGLQGPATLFQAMATHNAKDHAKLAGRHGLTKDVAAQVMGIPGQDMEAFSTAVEDMMNSAADTGKHKLSVDDRRKNIIKRLLAEEVVGTNLLPGMAPKKVEPSHHGRRHKATSRF
jgi:hypothetical protein